MAPFTPPQNIRTLFGAMALVLFLASLDQTIVSTALPTIAGDLGGLTHLSWLVTAYLLSSTIVGPLYGKLGDLYGRKIVLQVGIVIFLAGSILSGLAQSMPQLILFRILQGIGGGGLIVTVVAMIGDIIPPRERGKYQGIGAAMFGLSTLIGPLVGGFFVDHLNWRWIFYVNVPLGLIALIIIGTAFKAPPPQRQPVIDYLGATSLTAALSGIILYCSLGGTTFPWTSPISLALLAIGITATGIFILVERRAKEPILPLELFRNRTFNVCSGIGFVVGFSLFGSITYLPIYLQVVKGVTPTVSGLQLMPMMVGMLAAAIVSGRLISRFGRYRHFPIIGTGSMALGLFLLSRLSINSHQYQVAFDSLFFGLGMGMTMQVLTLATQNSVDYKHLGVATAGNAFFRAIGGAIGVAVFGAIFGNGLHARLTGPLAKLADINPTAAHALPPDLHAAYLAAVMGALEPIYLLAFIVAMAGFVLTWFIPETPLRGVTPSDTLSGAFPMLRDASSLDELTRIIDNLAKRENRWRLYADIAERARIDLSAPEIWLLYRLSEREPLSADQLSSELRMTQAELNKPIGGLVQRRLISVSDDDRLRLTTAGEDARDRILTARRRRREELLERWQPEKHPEAHAQFERLAEIVARELPLPKGM